MTDPKKSLIDLCEHLKSAINAYTTVHEVLRFRSTWVGNMPWFFHIAVRRTNTSTEALLLPDYLRLLARGDQLLTEAHRVMCVHARKHDLANAIPLSIPTPTLSSLPPAPRRSDITTIMNATLDTFGPALDLLDDALAHLEDQRPDLALARQAAYEVDDPINAAYGLLMIVMHSLIRVDSPETPELDDWGWRVQVHGMVESLRPRIEPQFRDCFGDAIGGGEFGYALDDIVYAVTESGYPVTIAERFTLRRLLAHEGRRDPAIADQVTIAEPSKLT